MLNSLNTFFLKIITTQVTIKRPLIAITAVVAALYSHPIPILFGQNPGLSAPENHEDIGPYPVNDPRYIWEQIEPFTEDHDTSEILASFPDDFLIGFATAASHMEDNLEDSWIEFARRGGVPAFDNVAQPEKRLNFFSDPETEIRAASEAGAQIYRLSLNWNRLMPRRPRLRRCIRPICQPRVQNREALIRYKEILTMIKDHGMKTMVTLFHHDLPVWSIPAYSSEAEHYLGWLDPQMPRLFEHYTAAVLRELGEDIDYLVTVNEPTLHSYLTYTLSHWPPGKETRFNHSFPQSLAILLGYKDFAQAMNHIIDGHKKAYAMAKKYHPDLPVGVSHITPYLEERTGIFGMAMTHFHDNVVVNYFPDSVIYHIDFLGVNYYGQEQGTAWDSSLELPLQNMFSDAGRQLNAQGLYHVLKNFHERYRHSRPDLEIFITENGIADDTDLIRMPYLLEHLEASYHALKDGVPLRGYLFWTLSDNWEWADGYCTKFGLMHVNRESPDFQRVAKPSYHLFRALTSTGNITENMMNYAHSALSRMQRLREEDPLLARRWDGQRGFCRGLDGYTGLHTPLRLPFITEQDWTFTPR